MVFLPKTTYMESENKPKIDPKWKANLLPENEKNVTIDDLKFIFGQAEKRMDDGIKNFDATTTKSVNFITFSTAILTALSAYFFSKFDPHGNFDEKLCTVLFCCLYTGYVLYRFVSIVLPKDYQPIGTFPQDLFVDDFFNGDNQWNQSEIKSPTWYIYLSELESYQRRIAQNSEITTSRLLQFNHSAKLICGMPVFGLAFYGFSLLLLSLF